MFDINQLTLGQLKEIASLIGDEKTLVKSSQNRRYVIVRTYAMGVFAGFLEPESTETLKVLSNARRIWAWAGAASLSQLAIDGTSSPENCKFPEAVSRIELTSPQGGFEILDVTEKAKKSIESVAIWKK